MGLRVEAPCNQLVYHFSPEHIGRNPDRPKYILGSSCFLIASFEREPLN